MNTEVPDYSAEMLIFSFAAVIVGMWIGVALYC